MDLIEKAKKNELEIFDFCLGEESYKYRFAKDSVSIFRYMFWGTLNLYNKSIIKGMVFLKQLLKKQ